jgi:phenylalanyl-tRNA synthetase beta chain
MYEGPTDEAVEVSNPLTEDFVYMRNTLIPSLLKVVSENKTYEDIKIFEIANIYKKKTKGLPHEILTLSGIIKNKNASFYQAKGYIEQLFIDLGIKEFSFKKSGKGMGSSVYIGKEYLGEIEVLDKGLIDFELNFDLILQKASLRREFKPFSKYPPVVEDLSFVSDDNISTDEIIGKIKAQSILITDASLTDSYGNSRTFHVVYQDPEKNLTKEETGKIREKIVASLKPLGVNLKD